MSFVSLSQAVLVESARLELGQFSVTTTYVSGKSMTVVMDGMRFAQFARLARKSGVEVARLGSPQAGPVLKAAGGWGLPTYVAPGEAYWVQLSFGDLR